MNKEQSQKLFSSIINYFNSNYEVKSSGKNNIKLGSRTHTVLQFTKRFMEEKDMISSYVGRLEFASLLDYFEKDKGWKEDKILEYMADKIFTALKMRVDEESKSKVTKADKGEMVEHSFNWINHLPVIDIKSNQSLMFNTTAECVDHEVSFGSWKEWVNTRAAEDKKILLQTVTPASIVYDPRKIQEVQYKTVSGQEGVLHLNAHMTPDWRRPENRITNPKLPKLFTELMEHLFADQESREYVYAWTYFMLTDRNHCYLLMHGDQGIGKTTLAMLLGALVGMSNYSTIGPEFWTGRFNGDLKYKRLCYFDESNITHDNMTQIRSLTNKYIRIEEKNCNAVDLENFASFIISNNTDNSVNLISYEDRRFSVPNMGTGNISLVKGQDWLDRLYNAIENDTDFIGNVGWWILENGDQGKFNPTQPFKSDTFYELVDNALTIWQKNVIEMIEDGVNDRYAIEDIREELRGTGRIKLSNFLDNHKDREGDQYGYVGQDTDGKRYVFASDKYKPKPLGGAEGNFDSVNF